MDDAIPLFFRIAGLVQVMENLESHGILVKVMESHGKEICFQKNKKAKT